MRTSFFALAFVGLALSTLVLSACGGAQARKQSYLERGDKYFAEQNYDKARVEYRNAMQIDPKDAQAHFAVGRTSEKLGNSKDAVAQYQAAIDADPNHLASRAALARLYLFGGVPDKALELAETGLTHAPNDPALLTVRGAVRAQKGQIESAFADANAALKQNPNDEYTIALLASLYRQSSRSDKAIEVVRAGIERLPANIDLRVVLADLEIGQRHPDLAEEQLKKVIEIEPKQLAHRYRLAGFYVSQKNIDAAESVMRDAIATVPEDAAAKMALVELLASQRDAAAAQKQLELFVAQNPKDDQLQLLLGAYYEQRQQTDQAEQSYRAVIDRSDKAPQGLSARNRLAALFLKRNDVPQATVLINEVLKESPRDNDALIMRGNIALARGDTASAITDLRTVLRDQPNAVPVMRALARAHIQNKEFALAEETLRNAVQINPRDTDTRMDLARFIAQMGKPEQARPILEQLAKEAPNDIDVLAALVRVHAAQKDYASARADAQRIKELRPDLALGYYLGGIVDEADGKTEAAVGQYETAIKLQPKVAEPLTALVRLELARKQPARALARVDQALALDSSLATAHSMRGELLSAQGKQVEAARSFESAIANAPQWWPPYHGLAVSNVALKNHDAAIAILRNGIDKCNGEPMLYTELASLYVGLNRTGDAIATYEEWLKRDPKAMVAANNLAMLLLNDANDQTKLKRAQQLAAQLAGSDDPAILDTRGWIDYKSGNYRQAVQLLERATEKATSSPVLKYHLGMAQIANGDPQAARKNLEAALSTGQAFHGVEEAQSALNAMKKAS